MKIGFGSDGGYTLVGNVFIDKYMPHAAGEFVKVYLYLLRCAGMNADISVSFIADVFEHTEKDVLRAFAYWEKLGLLKTTCDEAGNLTSVSLLSGAPEAFSAVENSSAPVSSVSAAAIPGEMNAQAALAVMQEAQEIPAEDDLVPPKPAMSAARVKELSSQDAIRQLVFVGSQYKKSPLRSTEIQNLIYFYDELHFSTDLIEYLMEYCVSKGNPGPHYMEKVAQEWYRSGIKSVNQAKESTSSYNKDFYTIMKYLGITGRTVTKPEAEFMDRWLGEYAFGLDLIEEACRRTVLSTGSGSFSYADSILKSWKEHNVHTMDDIRREDEAHARRSARSAANKNANAQQGQPTGSGAFGRFPQRDYNWNELEAQLLAAQSGKGE